MSYLRKWEVWILLICVNQISSTNTDVSISPSFVAVREGRNATVRCLYDGDKTLIGSTFLLNTGDIATITYPDCTGNLLLHLKNNYTVECEGNATQKLTIVDVPTNIHEKKVQCKLFFSDGTPSILSNDSAIIYVQVPIKSVVITSKDAEGDVVSVCEKSTLSFQCETSAARPAPNITWVYQSKFSAEKRIAVTSIMSKEKAGLDIASSKLNVTANRTLNNWIIFCSASNIPNEDLNSGNISFNILYSPVKSPTILNIDVANGEVYSIVEGRYGELTCTVPISNPLATLKWKGSDQTQTNVTNTLKWIASRFDEQIYNCMAEHVCSNYKMTISVKIIVLYPPTVNFMNNVSIIEGSMLNITCNVTLGIPKHAMYSWSRQKDTIIMKSQFLTKQNISRELSSTYTCTVANIMTPNVSINDKEERGENNGSLYIDVLYPPTVGAIKNIITSEGSYVNVSCPVHPGNPNNTVVTWTSGGNVTHVVQQILFFGNISRTHDMSYTCTASNIMKPTDSAQVNGKNSASFRLIVEYKAEVEFFFIKGQTIKNNVTLNEYENITFHCIVDSYPLSTTVIKRLNGQELISTISNNVSFSLGSAECLDAGIYECRGKNDRNVIHDLKQLILHVNCIPRIHPSVPVNKFITTPLNVTVVLSLFILAYPAPTSVVWQKLNDDKWTVVKMEYDTLIGQPEHSYNLTIFNITMDNIGQYRLQISNDIGELEQNFTIIAADKPYPPSDFRIVKEKTSTSSITVEWAPSFDGGQPQRFVLNISKSGDQTWKVYEVQDDKKLLMSFTFEGLSSGTRYSFVLYAQNNNGISFASETLSSKTRVEEVHTKKSILGIVLGVVFSLIGAILAVTFLIWIIRRRQRKVPGKSVYQNVPFSGTSMTKTSKISSILRETNVDEEDLQEVDDVPQLQTERTEYYNSLDKIGQIDRINVSELFQYFLGKDEDEFAIEYQKIPTELQMACTFARKPENIALNRYNGIYPYDHSRVKIRSQPDFFMNACYIDGFQRSNAYIASLGPTEKTTQNYVSFWQMVWHERSDIIVMLTNLREPSGMKCEQYWPDEGNMTYGEISVSCVKTEIFAEYTTRTFTLSKINETFTVTQLHYTAWPDKTVPEDVTSLLEFRQRMIATPTTSKGPIIVHCSAGIGRTGTLIAIDRLIAEGREKHSVNVFECVTSMRKQRVKMVQTLEQYIFIYKALVTALSFDCDIIPVKDFPRPVDGLHSSKYSRQYQQLKLTVEKDKKDEREAREKNEKYVNKNRIGVDIPGDRFRVFLYLDIEGDENYINAVYINSLKKKDMFITGQTPLPSTVKDFISMIYQENCICIVTMDDLNESEKTFGKYIFDNSKKHVFGNFKVSSSILETKHHYILREMKIKYEGKYDRGEKRVYHFQYKQWLGESDTPNNAGDFVRFVQEIQQYANELGDETSHILVHCMKANERSGIFCAVAIIMEMFQVHECASVTNTVRRIRTRRRSAITSQEQLLFCYRAGGAFIQQFGR